MDKRPKQKFGIAKACGPLSEVLRFRILGFVGAVVVVCFGVRGYAGQPKAAANELGGDKALYASIGGSAENRAITVHKSDGSVETVLTIAQLPEELEQLPIGLGNQSFADVALSPDGRVVGFAVKGHVGWAGLLDLTTRSVRPVLLVAEGSVDRLLGWSPDGRYLAVQVTPASGFKSIKIIDANSGGAVATPFAENAYTHEPDVDIINTSWDRSGTIFRFELRRAENLREAYEFSLRTHRLSRVPSTAGAR